MAATHFQGFGARRLFPCWDEPALQATFNISIMHYNWYTVFSNMPVRETKMIRNNMSWTHFETTPIMPSYLVAAIMANLSPFSNTNAVVMWCKFESIFYISFAQNIAENITLYLKEHDEWKRSIHISRINHIAIPNFQDERTINLGLVFYR